MLSILAIFVAADALPSGWESWGIVGFLLFAIMGLSAAVVALARAYVSLQKDRKVELEGYVLKAVYDDIKSRCDADDTRCNNCIYVNGETLRKIYEILGEGNGSMNLLIQTLTAIRQTLDQALLRGGN